MAKFLLDLYQIRPTQLYLDEGKIKRLKAVFNPLNVRNNPPLPIRNNGGEFFFTDGHTRAYLYDQAGISLIPVYVDQDPINKALYANCLNWCRKEQIMFISDLAERIVPHRQFEELWIKRCLAEEERLEGK
ncbi:MAG: hypothetical protein ABF608_09440 [Sporolactobacillus sp.]